MAKPDQEQYAIPSDTSSAGSQYNALMFLIKQALGERFTIVLVKVLAVKNKGEVAPVGFVDVQPMVNQLDPYGNSYPHGTVHELPYFRLQGGKNAVIIDPEVGDIGLALVADRDISAVKTTKEISNPGSMRRADLADGMYLGGFLNGTPEQYVQFTADGITLHSPKKITLDAPDISITAERVVIAATEKTTITTPQFVVNGTSQFNGTVTASGDVTGAGVSLKTHRHTGVTTGSGTSGPPQ